MSSITGKRSIYQFRSFLLKWYAINQRRLPWRQVHDPYKIWISEIMLQQTQISKAMPYYESFVRTFPTIKDLAGADLALVLKQWEGLGYYARARNLHKCAQTIVNNFNGKFPQDMESIHNLPGIGSYTAAAILSIAFNQSYPVLDGNVVRVLSRLFRLKVDADSPAGKKIFLHAAESLLSKKSPGNFNQAMMELGAMVCTPHSPACNRCPVARFCDSRKYDDQKSYPLRKKARKRPHYIVAAGVIRRSGQILIARRPEKGLLGGLWEFPGGKVKKNETAEQAVIREIREELDVAVAVTKKIGEIEHQYTHFTITLFAFDCVYLDGDAKAIGCSECRWVKPEELRHYAFPRANTKILEKFSVIQQPEDE